MKLYGNVFNDKYFDVNVFTDKNNMSSFSNYCIYRRVKYNEFISIKYLLCVSKFSNWDHYFSSFPIKSLIVTMLPV